MKLYGNVTCLLQHQVRYVREMDRLAVELVSTGAKINLRVGKDLRKKDLCVRICARRDNTVVSVAEDEAI